ncbi:hypothetical protein Rs2_35749 [Raphanus sativus]|nr:hypothetical protein Rs2_35749 [Raphanus sativus]
MKQWLRARGIPKEDKLSYALGMLIGKAHTWRIHEDAKTFFSNPVLNWGDLKARMYKEFVRKLRTNNKIPTRPMYQENRWSVISTTKPKPTAEQRHAYCPNPRKSLSTTKNPEEVEKTSQAKKYPGWTSTTSKRHYQATSKKEMSTSKSVLDTMQVKAKVSPILDKFVYKSSSTGMSHLSLSKNVKTGTEVQKDTISTSLLDSRIFQNLCLMIKEISNPKKEEAPGQGVITGLKEQEFKEDEPPDVTLLMDQKIVQDTIQSMMLNEAKTVLEVSHQGKCLTPPLDTNTDVCVLDIGRTDESYMLTEVPRLEPDHEFSHEPTPKLKPTIEQYVVQIPSLKAAKQHKLSKEEIHSSTCGSYQSCKEESYKEIPPDTLLLLGGSTPRETRNVAKETLKIHPPQKRFNGHKPSRGVILSHFFKEEPPNAPCITKQKLYQGKVLNSQKRMKPDLLYCGVSGYSVLRSKPLQGGGNDEDIKSVADPEVQEALPDEEEVLPKQEAFPQKQKSFLNRKPFQKKTKSFLNRKPFQKKKKSFQTGPTRICVQSKQCISLTRRNLDMKPIFMRSKLNKETSPIESIPKDTQTKKI